MNGENVQKLPAINGSNGKIPGGITGKGFRPGFCANPGGRPAGKSIGAQLRKALTATRRAELAEKLIAMSLAGDAAAMKILFDRHDGAVRSEVALAMGEPPQPGETAAEFYERLKTRSGETVARHFPGFDPALADEHRITVVVREVEESLGN